MTHSSSNLFPHSKLDSLPAEKNDACSSVIEDSFNFVNHMKVPTHPSFKKSYFVSCREALFSWNPCVLAKVKSVLAQEEGMSKSKLNSHLC